MAAATGGRVDESPIDLDLAQHADPRATTGSRTLLLLVAFLACWILPPFWRIATLQSVNIQNDVFTSDLLNAGVPLRAFIGASLRHGELPSWTTGIYTGFPVLAQAEHGPLYPFNWLFFTLLPPYVAVAFSQLLPLFLAGAGLFLLVREWRLPIGPALFAAGAFCLSGFFVSHLRHLSMNDAACWIPFLFLCGERVVQGQSKYAPIVLALLWALQLLAGNVQISFYTGIVIFPFLMARAGHVDPKGPETSWHWPLYIIKVPGIRKVALALALGTLLAGVQLLPCLELAQLTHRKDFSYFNAVAFPASPKDVVTFFFPYHYGDVGNGTFPTGGVFWERYGYVGLLPVLLAMTGAIAGWNRYRLVQLLSITVIIAYFMYLGKYTPVFKLGCALVPGLSYFRFPTRFLIFIELGLAVLAGFGMSWVSDKLRDRRWQLAFVVVVSSITAVDLWTHQMRQVPQVSWSEWTAPVETAEFLMRERERTQEPWRYLSLDSVRRHEMAFQEARGWTDVSPYVRHRDMLQPSTNLLYGLESVDGYIQLVPREYEALWASGWQNGAINPPRDWISETGLVATPFLNALRAFNVRYLLSAGELQSDSLTLVFRARSGVRIYELSGVLPRAFVVGHVRPVSSDDDVRAMLLSAGFDPRGEAIVAAPFPPLTSPLSSNAASSTKVDFSREGGTVAKVQVSLQTPGLLVLSEGFYPGWRATLDGVDVPIVRANSMMRAVAVPAGEHDVVFRFRPWSVMLGLAVTILGAIGLLLTSRWSSGYASK